MYEPCSYYDTFYSTPICLHGSGDVVLVTHKFCRTAFPVLTFPFNNHDYSIGMWLIVPSILETVTFNMQFNDFLLKFTLKPTYFLVFCSNMSGLEAKARIRVPLGRWFHIVLTYSSMFRLYINGRAYSLICAEGPLSENQMSERAINTNNDGYLILFYEGYIKFLSNARFADIQVLPCALTLCEIHAIIKQRTCMEQLNMGRYLLDHWTSMRWYSKYLCSCILS